MLGLAAKGQTNKAIGVMLGISDRTVQGHLARIYRKLAANSRTEAVMKGVSLGLIDAEIEARAPAIAYPFPVAGFGA